MSADERKEEDVRSEEENFEESFEENVEEIVESKKKVDETPMTNPGGVLGGVLGSSSVSDENKYSGPVNFIAWANLIISAIFGVYILYEYGSVEVESGYYFTYTETVLSPIGVGLGVGIIAQGVIVFLLLKIIQTMADDVAALKNLKERAD